MIKKEEKFHLAAVLSALLILAVSGIRPVITGAATIDEGTKLNVFSYFTKIIFPTIWSIISVPVNQSEMLWAIAPLLLALLFIEVYFGRWKNEKIGWNTAFANSIALLFVSINLFSILWAQYSADLSTRVVLLPRFILLLVLIIQSLLLMTLVYFHAMPKSVSFFLASPLTINLLAVISIVLIYSNLPLNIQTFTAALIVYIALYLFFIILRALVPASTIARRYIKKKEEEKAVEKEIKRQENSRKKGSFFGFLRKR